MTKDLGKITRPEETCWRIERANTVSVIIDAADYFFALRSAISKAKHTVMMIGWEFDTRVSLDPCSKDTSLPDKLGDFLNWAAQNRPDLTILLLAWDTGVLQTLTRGSTPLKIADWAMSDQIRMKLDHAHPSGASHHQKIVVIDDVLAFCGGIDTTADRWDTRDHLDTNAWRTRPTTGRAYGPWHDATTAMDGDVAKALGDLARERWHTATGEKLDPPPARDPLWPDCLEKTFENVDVAISRTAPEYNERPALHEIENLYLDIIKNAQKTLYIESQYFGSKRLTQALCDSLKQENGPEIVIVNPIEADGWMEEKVMGSSRARLLRDIKKADIHNRFKIYTPVAKEGTDIYVHAKIVICDDILVRIGSSNLSNRSMGFDTECDLSIEATGNTDPDAIRRTILRLRSDLLAEHLDVTIEDFEKALNRQDSLIKTIESLRGEGRTLVPFTPPNLDWTEKNVLGESNVLDPARPDDRWRAVSYED